VTDGQPGKLKLFLWFLHFVSSAIHGDKSQGERDHVLRSFREGRTPILVATDVASRGLGMYKVSDKSDPFVSTLADPLVHLTR